MEEEKMALKICFRGDTRAPTADGKKPDGTPLPGRIFLKGFQAVDMNTEIGLKIDDEFYKNIDIVSKSAVCVSARIPGAVLFPLLSNGYCLNRVGPNWLYIMAIDTASVNTLNTHALQVYFSQSTISLDGSKATPEAVMVWLCAQELAVKEVPNGRIIAALRYIRGFNGDDWKAGGGYTLAGPIEENTYCNVPDAAKKKALKFIRDELEKHTNGRLPVPADGFHASTMDQELPDLPES
jgi:hypothetical protein